MRESLSGPTGVGSRIFHGNPSYRLVCPPWWKVSIFPVAQEIMIVPWVIGGRIQELFELGVGHGNPINIETVHMNALPMKAPWTLFPGILYIDSGIVAAFDFNPTYLKIVVPFRNADHARRWTRCRLGCGNLDNLLRRSFPFSRVAGERTLGTPSHV